MLDCLLDHKAHEHFFEVIDAPTLQRSRELLMRNIEKICQWLGMVKPEQMRKGSRHEDLKGDTVALAKLVMKEDKKRFCRKVRFLGKIQKSSIRNSMTYRLPNSRKSNFATEPV